MYYVRAAIIDLLHVNLVNMGQILRSISVTKYALADRLYLRNKARYGTGYANYLQVLVNKLTRKSPINQPLFIFVLSHGNKMVCTHLCLRAKALKNRLCCVHLHNTPPSLMSSSLPKGLEQLLAICFLAPLS